MDSRTIYQTFCLTMLLIFGCTQPKPQPQVDVEAGEEIFEEMERRSTKKAADSEAREQSEAVAGQEKDRLEEETAKDETIYYREYPKRLSNGWIRSFAEVEWPSDKPRAKVQAYALLKARSEAIAFVNGVRINDIILVYEDSDVGLDIARMTKEMRGGHITDKGYPQWSVLQRPGADFPYGLSVIIDVNVEKGVGTSDRKFRLDKPTLNKERYQAGDLMTMQISATQDCYITVFNQSRCEPDGPVTVLFPNEYSGENKLSAGDSLSIPDSNGWRLRMGVPQGFSECWEVITVVATKYDVPFKTLKSENWVGGFMLVEYKSRAEDMARWLLDIPLDERTESTILYKSYK